MASGSRIKAMRSTRGSQGPWDSSELFFEDFGNSVDDRIGEEWGRRLRTIIPMA